MTMIKLDVYEFCQNCTEFEPQVTQRPEQYNDNFGNTYWFGDTIIKCKYRQRCEAIYEYLKVENNKPLTFNEIRKAVGLEPIGENDKDFAQLHSEKENKDD